MDNGLEGFVASIRANIDNSVRSRMCYSNNNRYRNLISLITNRPPPKIIIDDIDKDGDIKFYISMKELGINFEIFSQYKTEIFSDFIVNFLGELIVRENLDEFSKILTSIKNEDYHKFVNRFEHYQFGMEVMRDKFIFTFHISLIQNILMEPLKRKMKNG